MISAALQPFDPMLLKSNLPLRYCRRTRAQRLLDLAIRQPIGES
jgi:hypothetical protein